MSDLEQKLHEQSALAYALLGECHRGFENEFHHANWLKKHQTAIDDLPKPWRDAVLHAHDQAVHYAGPR